MRQKVFTLANQLTFLRLLLIPFVVLMLLQEEFLWGLGLLLAAGLTDLLDGTLARWLKQRTPLGAYLDPITDKLLLSACFIVLAVRDVVPWSLSVLVLARDVLILVIALVIIVGAGFRRFSPTPYGKACTTVQVVTVFVVVLVQVTPQPPLVWLNGLLLWLTAALTVLSGVHYAWRTGRLLQEIHPHP